MSKKIIQETYEFRKGQVYNTAEIPTGLNYNEIFEGVEVDAKTQKRISDLTEEELSNLEHFKELDFCKKSCKIELKIIIY